MPDESPSPQNDQGRAAAARWGGLGTAIWGMLLIGIYIAIQSLVYTTVLVARFPDATDEELTRHIGEYVDNGLLLALANVSAAVIVVPLMLLIIKLKKGASIADYLALRSVAVRTIGWWLLIAFALGVVFDLVKWLIGLEIIPSFGIDTYRTRGSTWIFFPAVMLVAPLIEETFFRGFMLSGLERTALGAFGAIVVTAALWAVMHTQYGLFDVVWIFTLGCVLGLSRLYTQSIYPALVTHIVVNVLAYVVIAVVVEQTAG